MRRMPVKYPIPMNWFDKLFWHTCIKCKEGFKNEIGWKGQVEIDLDGGRFRDYICHKCHKEE
jgi:hypothetical protein